MTPTSFHPRPNAGTTAATKSDRDDAGVNAHWSVRNDFSFSHVQSYWISGDWIGEGDAGIGEARFAVRQQRTETRHVGRFGPGDKMVLLRETESHSARRETTFNAAMSMDGGVGASLN